MDSSMVSLQARFSSLFLLRCAGLRLRLGAERLSGRKLNHSPFGRGVKGTACCHLHATASRNGGHVRDDLDAFS